MMPHKVLSGCGRNPEAMRSRALLGTQRVFRACVFVAVASLAPLPAHAAGPGGGIAAANRGAGALEIAEGGGSPLIWSYDLGSGAWRVMVSPVGIGRGGAIAATWLGADYWLAGGDSLAFFQSSGSSGNPARLSDALVKIGAGAGLTAAPGVGGAP